MVSVNPFEAPKTPIDDVPAGVSGADEIVRKTHLAHETRLKGVGGLWILGGILFALLSMVSAAGALSTLDPVAMGGVAMYTVFAFGQLWTGFRLRRLHPVARGPSLLIAAIGLIGFPIGTAISVYVLYLLLSAKGRFVLSDEYARVVQATPHIKYRAPIWQWVLFALLVAGLIGLSAYSYTLVSSR